MRLRETSFVDVREFDLAVFSLLNRLPNSYVSLPEPLFISFFFKLCRVRFQTSPARLSAPVRVLTCTRTPNFSSSRANSAVAVSASYEAHPFNCSSDRFDGAPLRGASDGRATPFASHR